MINNTTSTAALFFNGEHFSRRDDVLAVEVGLSISINQTPFTVTMQTPGNETALAIGLLYTENIFRSKDFIPKIDIIEKDKDGFVTAVNIEIPDHLILKDFAGTRNIMSASSCGMCGKTSIDESEEKIIYTDSKLNPFIVKNLFDQVSNLQKSFQLSGGTHAAGAFTIEGELLTMQEDIGRHNAVDKAIGYLIQNNLLEKARCITVSGRISYEIVHKIKMAKIPYLASVSAPSSLAVKYAADSGICLMAFCRNEKMTIYSNEQMVEQTQKFLINN